MKISLRILILISFVMALFLLSACQQKEAANEIKVGTISGPETELMEVAKRVAEKKYDLDIKIVPFTDYTMPNAALSDGSIDANMFQTIPYFDADINARHYRLSIIGKTFIYPMAIYSKKISNIKDTPKDAIVAVPNDPSNEARALLLLQKAGLIKLKPGSGVFATTLDIEKNPLQLRIKQLDAAQLPRVLSDVTLAVINTNYAIPAGLFPTKDSIFMEAKDSPYANVVVVRTADKDNPKFKELVASLHSKAVLNAADKLFHGQAIPAWDAS